MSKLLNAPFSRVGGKNKLKKTILKLFPPVGSYNKYIEPFVGAGNIILNAPIVKTMIGADTDTNLINTHHDIKKVSEEDIKSFNFRPNKKKFDKFKKELGTIKDPKTRLYQYLYFTFNSFKTRGSGKKLKKNIELIKEIYKHIKFIKLDFVDTINKYDSPTTFFYLDPPYHDTYAGDYETGNIDHQKLADMLRNIKGKFLLSHNDTPFIRKLYKGFKFKTIKVQQSLKSNEDFVKEVLIKNY
jgi:DNA adenine methylase